MNDGGCVDGSCEVFVEGVAGDPDDSAGARDHGDAIAFSGGYFGVDEEVLELAGAAASHRSDTVTRASAADSERGIEGG